MSGDESIGERLAKFLSENKAVVIQTDTVLGILSLDENLIIKAKNRGNTGKKTIRFIDHHSKISPNLPQDLINILEEYWPGELTIIYKGISYRSPNSKHILQALKQLGRHIYASSANITSYSVAKTIEEAKEMFKGSEVPIKFINTAENISNTGQPSTIYDYDRDEILREGRISREDILRARKRTEY